MPYLMAMEIDVFPGMHTTARPGQLPYAGEVAAGFPSPAEDHMEACLSLDAELVRHPSSTFFGRARGRSMVEAGIHDGDILVIDRSLPPVDGCTAVCFVDGGMTLKRIAVRGRAVYLVPANREHPELQVDPDDAFAVWGVVTHVIHKL